MNNKLRIARTSDLFGEYHSDLNELKPGELLLDGKNKLLFCTIEDKLINSLNIDNSINFYKTTNQIYNTPIEDIFNSNDNDLIIEAKKCDLASGALLVYYADNDLSKTSIENRLNALDYELNILGF